MPRGRTRASSSQSSPIPSARGSVPCEPRGACGPPQPPCAAHGDPSYVNTFVDQVKSVTADEVREAAGTWLDPDARAVVRLPGRGRGRGGGMTSVARPEVAPPPQWSFPEGHPRPAQRDPARHLRRTRPVRRLRASWPARPDQRRAAGPRGVATIMARTMDEGTRSTPPRSWPACSSARESLRRGRGRGRPQHRPRCREGEPRAGARPAAADHHRTAFQNEVARRCARGWRRSTRSVPSPGTARRWSGSPPSMPTMSAARVPPGLPGDGVPHQEGRRRGLPRGARRCCRDHGRRRR